MPAKTPELRTAYEGARKRSEQVLLRFTPEEAQQVRAAAAGGGLSLADFVLACVQAQPRPIVDLAEVAQISSAVAVLAGVPKGMRDLEADLGRLSGRLAHLFTLNYERASLHRQEIHDTLFALQNLLRRLLPEMERARAAVAEPSMEIASVMRAIARELEDAHTESGT